MKLAVIENAGYQGERLRFECASWADAYRFIERAYSADERDTLHVDVAHWDEAEEFWSYDH